MAKHAHVYHNNQRQQSISTSFLNKIQLLSSLFGLIFKVIAFILTIIIYTSLIKQTLYLINQINQIILIQNYQNKKKYKRYSIKLHQLLVKWIFVIVLEIIALKFGQPFHFSNLINLTLVFVQILIVYPKKVSHLIDSTIFKFLHQKKILLSNKKNKQFIQIMTFQISLRILNLAQIITKIFDYQKQPQNKNNNVNDSFHKEIQNKKNQLLNSYQKNQKYKLKKSTYSLDQKDKYFSNLVQSTSKSKIDAYQSVQRHKNQKNLRYKQQILTQKTTEILYKNSFSTNKQNQSINNIQLSEIKPQNNQSGFLEHQFIQKNPDFIQQSFNNQKNNFKISNINTSKDNAKTFFLKTNQGSNNMDYYQQMITKFKKTQQKDLQQQISLNSNQIFDKIIVDVSEQIQVLLPTRKLKSNQSRFAFYRDLTLQYDPITAQIKYTVIETQKVVKRVLGEIVLAEDDILDMIFQTGDNIYVKFLSVEACQQFMKRVQEGQKIYQQQ